MATKIINSKNMNKRPSLPISFHNESKMYLKFLNSRTTIKNAMAQNTSLTKEPKKAHKVINIGYQKFEAMMLTK